MIKKRYALGGIESPTDKPVYTNTNLFEDSLKRAIERNLKPEEEPFDLMSALNEVAFPIDRTNPQSPTYSGIDSNLTVDPDALSVLDRRNKRMSRLDQLNNKFNDITSPIVNSPGFLLGGVDALISLDAESRQDERLKNRLRSRIFTQDPITNLNEGKDENPIIMAKDGARVRRGLKWSADAELEDGEMLLLPDQNIEWVKGKKHSKGGVDTIIPPGTDIFSASLLLKEGEFKGMTPAKAAKKYDYSEDLAIINNPTASVIDKNTAETNYNRKLQKLREIFSQQQSLNGDSNGEVKFKKGGKKYYKEGAEIPLPDVELISRSPYRSVTYSDYRDKRESIMPTYKDDLSPESLMQKRTRLKDKFESLKRFGFSVEKEPDFSNMTQDDMNKFVGNMQSFLEKQAPEVVSQYMETFGPTNLGRRDPKAPNRGFKDNLWWYRAPEFVDVLFEDKTQYDEFVKNKTPYSFAGNSYYQDEFNNEFFVNPKLVPKDYNTNVSSTPKASEATLPSGNEYTFERPVNNKIPYERQSLQPWQIGPEMLGFIEGLNTYPYFTPDVQHWEINPQELNIQPQLSSIDSSLRSVMDIGGGSSSIRNIRNSSAFTEALKAKQIAFANKQNFDAQSRFSADSYNINARNVEQQADLLSASNIYNQNRALAKDYAAESRIDALSAIRDAVAGNMRNENKIKLFNDNFLTSFDFDPDHMEFKLRNKATFTKPYLDPTSGLIK